MTFDVNKTIKYWSDGASYDLETGRSPDEKKDFYKKCTEEFTQGKFSGIESVYKWLTQKLTE